MATDQTRLGMRRMLVGVLALAALALLSGCGVPAFGMRSSTTQQGARTYSLWQWMFVLAIAVGALVWGLIIFSVVRYRRRRGDDSIPANQNPYNIPIEIVYTVVPILMVLGIFAVTLGVQRKNDRLSSRPDVSVEVTGFQWQWQFGYPSEGFTVTGNSVAGQPPIMVLPVGSTVRLHLVAADVAHSFWVPKFLMKRDLIPGVDNRVDVDTQKVGTYVGRCAEYCGLDHWRMNFGVKVVSVPEYHQWVRDQRANHPGRGA